MVVQKRFLKYPQYSVYHAETKNRQGMVSGTRNSRGLTENVGRSRAARRFRIVKIFSHLTRNSTLFWNSWIWVKSWLTVVGSLSWCIDNLCSSICFFATSSSQFFNFLSIFCWIFSEGSTPRFHYYTQAYFYFFERDQPIDSPVVAVIVGI